MASVWCVRVCEREREREREREKRYEAGSDRMHLNLQGIHTTNFVFQIFV